MKYGNKDCNQEIPTSKQNMVKNAKENLPLHRPSELPEFLVQNGLVVGQSWSVRHSKSK